MVRLASLAALVMFGLGFTVPASADDVPPYVGSHRAELLKRLFKKNKPIIGVIYMEPSLGYKGHPGMKVLIDRAVAQMKILEAAGVDAVLLENDSNDPSDWLAPPEVIATMTAVMSELVKQAKTIVVGTEFLLNDPKASLAIAKASGCRFIRTDYFSDKMHRDKYGPDPIPIDPEGLLAYRKKLGAEDIAIFADIQVKYATPLEGLTLAESAKRAIAKGADGIIVTADKSGKAPTPERIQDARAGALDFPIIQGSGFSPENAPTLYPLVDAVIVGTSIMDKGVIQKAKVETLMNVVRQSRKDQGLKP